MSEKTPFELWWYNVGSGINPGADEDMDGFLRRVAWNAWLSALQHAQAVISRDDDDDREAA